MNTFAPAAATGAHRAAPVRYGSLTFAASARRYVDAAFTYLSQDTVERSLIDRLVDDSPGHRIVINHHNDDSYDPNRHAIHWDPHSALLTSLGGRQSPALGLGHEIDHAVANAWVTDRLTGIPDPRYDNAEERRVILGSEHHAARTLHEAIRHDHGGTCYHVPSPIVR